MHEPCVMWYLSPFACLYDLLQFGFGHLNGFDSSRLDAGRLSVVDARGVCAAELELDACAFDDEPEPEDDPAPDDDACAFCLYADAPEPPGIGEATRDDAGVESGVFPALPLSSSAVGAHTTPFAFCPLLWLPFMGPSAMPCCMKSDAFGVVPGRRLE